MAPGTVPARPTTGDPGGTSVAAAHHSATGGTVCPLVEPRQPRILTPGRRTPPPQATTR